MTCQIRYKNKALVRLIPVLLPANVLLAVFKCQITSAWESQLIQVGVHFLPIIPMGETSVWSLCRYLITSGHCQQSPTSIFLVTLCGQVWFALTFFSTLMLLGFIIKFLAGRCVIEWGRVVGVNREDVLYQVASLPAGWPYRNANTCTPYQTHTQPSHLLMLRQLFNSKAFPTFVWNGHLRAWINKNKALLKYVPCIKSR